MHKMRLKLINAAFCTSSDMETLYAIFLYVGIVAAIFAIYFGFENDRRGKRAEKRAEREDREKERERLREKNLSRSTRYFESPV